MNAFSKTIVAVAALAIFSVMAASSAQAGCTSYPTYKPSYKPTYTYQNPGHYKPAYKPAYTPKPAYQHYGTPGYGYGR